VVSWIARAPYVEPARDPIFRIFASTSAVPIPFNFVMFMFLEDRANTAVRVNETVKTRRVDDEM